MKNSVVRLDMCTSNRTKPTCKYKPQESTYAKATEQESIFWTYLSVSPSLQLNVIQLSNSVSSKEWSMAV